MPGALEGIRVIDFTQILAGPYATSLLGDMGAEIIKVEQPKVGDRARPSDGVTRLGAFAAHNRNKQSVTVDLRSPKGREIIGRLIETADACINNFRPGFMDRIGLGYEALRRRNPRLVYAVGTGYGLKGPLVERAKPKPAVDIVGQAMTGLMAASRDHQGYPLGAGAPVTDQAQGILLAFGIALALLARERTGRGQMVESSLLGATLALQTGQIGLRSVGGQPLATGRRTHLADPIYGSYRASDGYLVIGPVNANQWQVFCHDLGLPEIADDPRFADPVARGKHSRELGELLDEALLQRPTAEWMSLFDEADIIAAPVYEYGQMVDDPQFLANDYLVDFELPTGGTAKVVGVPVKLSDTPGGIFSGVPELGEQTEAVLRDVGYSKEEIRQLAAEGVI